MQTPGADPYQDSDELFVLDGKDKSPAKGTQWEVAPSISGGEGADNSSLAIWRALLAIDVQTRAAASRRVGCVKWQFELSVRRRLALARAEAAAAAADAAADEAAMVEVLPAQMVPSSSQLVATSPAAMFSVVADATAAAGKYSNRFGLSSSSSGRALKTEAEALAKARLPSRLTVGLDDCAGLSQPLLHWQAQGVFTNVAGAAAVVAPNTAALAPKRVRALLARGAGTTAYFPADTDDIYNADFDGIVEVKQVTGLGTPSSTTTTEAGVRGSGAVPQNDDAPPRSNAPVATTPTSATTSGSANRVKRPRKNGQVGGPLPSLPALAPGLAAPLEVQGTNEEEATTKSARNPRRRRERAM
jgi:hypothetical protein